MCEIIAEAVLSNSNLVAMHKLEVFVPNQVHQILTSAHTSRLPSRRVDLQNIFFFLLWPVLLFTSVTH